MRINNKTFKEWIKEDISILLNNDDFRESQFLDYKRNFEFLEGDKFQKAKGKDEFRNDVCSFANADGGDLFFGISEKNGLASAIMPISIDNIDRFELDLRNVLLSIMPSVPPVEFHFIAVSGGYVVVIHIEKGIFKPYMTVENQTTFRFFIRRGNHKEAMSYSEISNNFLQAASLASEIKRFRLERISEWVEDSSGTFGVIHIIPATFQNPADFIQMCDLGKAGKIPIPLEYHNHIRGRMLPNVDGIWFPSDDDLRNYEMLSIFDNGSVELKQDLHIRTIKDTEYLISDEFIGTISDIIMGTVHIYRSLERHAIVYICISIIGCKGYWNYDTGVGIRSQPTKVDRDRILCAPIEIKDILNMENVSAMIEECKKRTRYVLGIKR